jgi:AcrR family transcriptional regulator
VSLLRQDQSNRVTLLNAAARLIAVGGPQSLSARRLAAATGMSTMAVYTYFASMDGIVREVTRDGFKRLERLFMLAGQTGDPVADMAMLGRIYRYNAMTNGHAFEVMFGSSNLAGFALTEEDRLAGRSNLSPVVECAQRCVAAGRFTLDDPVLIAHHMWMGVHGTTMLELGRYLVPPYDGNDFLEQELTSLMVGAGDDRARAKESVTASLDRFNSDFGPAM